ncbi:hypothetical protein [Candidatus Solirubrobacter pratensis]|uniref:hypothetical protein n=1 Tax=Candidatus Solirubrobacter pratensis TaxID=1298857 RepID=UPI000489BC49|nr:hypothetical protein [Candidatus Solirubrobacter pratensis]
MRPALVLLLVAALLGAAAAPARAAGLEIGMEDERLLLGGGPDAVAAAADWKALGVDVVRIHAQWGSIAPRRRPAGFDAADPGDPRYGWGALDRAVGIARAAGLEVMLTVTGPGPAWTSRVPARHNPRWEPSATEFGRFAHAVAARYGGLVDRYLIWNEPNQPGWLQPQSECRRRVCTPVAPHVYRALVRAATPQIHAADPGSEVLLGELAPVGDPPRHASAPLAPLPFLRALGCVDRAYRPLRGGRCAGFKPAAADAFGYHPHPVRNAPDHVNPDRDEAQIADLPRLFATLDKLTARKRILTPGDRFPVHLTEFGYQTSPPDHAIGITLAQQARYLQQASYIAWRSGRVRSLSFYQWDDEPVLSRGPGTRAYTGWQSGLRFVDGRPKPALATFPAPLVIDRSRGVLWGQVRPDAAPEVTVMIRSRGEAAFRDLETVTAGADGAFELSLALEPGASYRYRWAPAPPLLGPAPAPRLSGTVDLARPEATRLRASES